MQDANIIVYRDKLLPLSQGFVKAQGESLSSYRPHYFGSRRVAGIELPAERLRLLNRRSTAGWARESAFKLLGRAPRFEREMGRLAPALIHAHFGTDGALILPVATRLGVPLIVTFHGYEITFTDDHARRSHFSHRLLLRRRKELCERASLLIAVSSFIRDTLIARGAPAEKVVVHYVGIDMALFVPDPAVRREPIVLFVGRLVRQKGCHVLIQAMARLAGQSGAELVVIGDGPERAALERLCAATLRRYRFLGGQPSPVVRGWMNRARVLCGPSLTDHTGEAEALGLVFLEAQAMGLPVVSCSSGGIPEAVADGRTGILVAEGDRRALAAAIAELLSDDGRWQAFSDAARAHVAAKFDLARQALALESLYARAVSPARR